MMVTAEVSSIPLQQFFPFGVGAGDEILSLGDDDSSLPIALNPPFTILKRQRESLHVSMQGYSHEK